MFVGDYNKGMLNVRIGITSLFLHHAAEQVVIDGRLHLHQRDDEMGTLQIFTHAGFEYGISATIYTGLIIEVPIQTQGSNGQRPSCYSTGFKYHAVTLQRISIQTHSSNR